MKKQKKLGSTPSSEQNEIVFRIEDTELERKWEWRPADVGPAESLMCRQQTGLPVESFVSTFGQDSVVVIIWMARLQEGERVSYAQVAKEYSAKGAFERLHIEVEEPDEEEDGDPTPDEVS